MLPRHVVERGSQCAPKDGPLALGCDARASASTALLWTTVGALPSSSLFPKTQQPESGRHRSPTSTELIMDQGNEKLPPTSKKNKNTIPLRK